MKNPRKTQQKKFFLHEANNYRADQTAIAVSCFLNKNSIKSISHGSVKADKTPLKSDWSMKFIMAMAPIGVIPAIKTRTNTPGFLAQKDVCAT
ncbi:MAG: hypothetical protein LH618_13445 [Saprospiraceae bacterium]|nr:hypothetical protein [Saprospiraceae bacterium]